MGPKEVRNKFNISISVSIPARTLQTEYPDTFKRYQDYSFPGACSAGGKAALRRDSPGFSLITLRLVPLHEQRY